MPFNPQNPLVYNDRYFANVTNLRYEDTTISSVAFYNLMAAICCGFMSICLVIYLVLFKTPVHFRPYSKMLLLCSSADLYFLFAEFWCQTRFFIRSGLMMVSLRGPSSFLGYYGQCYSVSLQATGPMLAGCSLPVQYYIRYHAIKNKNPLSARQIILLFMISIFFTVICGFTTAYAFCTFDNPERINFAQYWYEEVPTPQIMIAPQYHLPLTIHMTYFVGTMCVAYIVAMTLARKTVMEMKTQASNLSPKTKSMQKQFARTLFAQSLTPLITALFPLFISLFTMVTGIGTVYAGYAIAVAFEWFPFLNSVGNIFFIVPYRTRVKRWLAVLIPFEIQCVKRKPNAASVTVVSTTSISRMPVSVSTPVLQQSRNAF